MAKKAKHYGEYAFLAGIALALIISVLSSNIPDDNRAMGIAVLAVLGIVVGLSNIEEKESPVFLIAALTLIMAVKAWEPLMTGFGVLGEFGNVVAIWLGNFIQTLVAFVSPAAFVVALKRIYHLGRG